MKTFYFTSVIVNIILLFLSQSSDAESTGPDKSTSKQTSKEKTSTPPKTTTTRKEETSHSSILQSSQWQVTKLKSTDFTTKVIDKDTKLCKREKIADAVKRRKEEYYADASVIQYVSAFPLNATQENVTRCKTQTRRNEKGQHRFYNVDNLLKKGQGPANAAPQEKKRPCRAGENADDCELGPPEYGPEDYAFSSIEYYDENASFGIGDCPDALEKITLDIAELRQYDFQCEMLTKWVGLDDPT